MLYLLLNECFWDDLMIKKNGIIIWPLYFDRKIPRSKCRKVSLDKAIEKPSIEKIAEAAKRLGFKIEIERNCVHPSFPWKKIGRVIIKDCNEKKSKILNLISIEINKMK